MHSIVIGCDSNAAEVKKEIVKFLTKKAYNVTMIYANVAIKVATSVVNKKNDRGILICGIGVSIAANKVKGANAALVTDVYSAERARKSNNANIACFGAFTVGIRLMEKLVETFLTSEYVLGCPSQPKVDRICEYESIT